MSARILITYATRYGSTADVAAQLGRSLSAYGHVPVVAHVKEVRDLTGYDAAVIGSAIRMGSWLPEAVAFVKRHRAELAQLPVAIFTCHMNNTDAAPVSVEARQAYTAPIRQLVSPRAEACFCGMIERERLNFVDRLMVDAVKKNTGLALGDFRDWQRIDAWADDLQTMLSAVSA